MERQLDNTRHYKTAERSFNSRPPVKRLVPEWGLQLVLNALSGELFEPLNKISLKCLTL